MNAANEKSAVERSIHTLLFDLDGTLLDINMPDLLDGYFRLLARRFDAEGDFIAFRKHMMGAVGAMMENRNPSLVLEDIFLAHLSPRLDRDGTDIKETFRRCHLGEFNELRSLTRPAAGADRLVRRALELGYRLALATNPVFFIEAITARLDWTEIPRSSFRFISSAETMHYCKPHREYFAEVLGKTGSSAGEAAMIGNDPRKDMPAAAAGLFTFHVSLGGGGTDDGGADRSGKLADVLSWVEELGPAV